MKDLILICAVAAVLVFGYFIVKKVYIFLENSRKQTSEISKRSSLRIAFETPAGIESASELMKKFSNQYPDCEFYLFCGSAQEIVNKMKANEIDFGFITENSICAFDKEYVSILIPLRQNAITMESIGLSVTSLENSEIMARVIWNEKNGTHYQKRFEEYINSKVF